MLIRRRSIENWHHNLTLFFRKTRHSLSLVIQHASLRTQKKYYPLILEAEKNRKILSSNVAILEDRIAIREGRQQTYGSRATTTGNRKSDARELSKKQIEL